ncbi:MAG TPA: sulfatase [Patescibacteria group bacterium]|nr:sulfatase [Patescibacteria group bacterium]
MRPIAATRILAAFVLYVAVAPPVRAQDAAPPPAPSPAPSHPRNGIVLVTVDSLRADRLGCYGGGANATPGLDALAAGGVRFSRAYATSVSTVPSTASILTGLFPSRLGLRHDLGGRLADGVVTLASQLRSAGWSTVAVVGTDHLDTTSGLNRGFDRFDDDIQGIHKRGVFLSFERRASEVVEAALIAYDALPADRPFFLWLNMHDPHFDYDPPAPGKDQPAPPTPYDGEVGQVDSQIGALVASLRGRGAQPAYVVAGAHGEGLDDHKEEGHGTYLYETTVRVPLLIALSSPGAARGKVVDDPVSLVDLAPTILTLAQATVPAGLDGVSLAPFLGDVKAAGETGGSRPAKSKSGRPAARPARRLFAEAAMPLQAYGWSPLYAVIEGNHKVVQGARLEAFDLATDPKEEKPLAPVPSWAASLTGFGTPLLGRLGPTDEDRRKIMAAAQALPLPWADSPFCAEKDSRPDPRDPERVALNGKLYEGRVRQEQGLVGWSMQNGQAVLETDPANLMGLDFVVFTGLRNRWGDMLMEMLETMQCDYPYEGVGYHYLGHLYESDRKPEKALAAFRVFALAEPWSTEAELDVAASLGAAGRINEALDHVAKAVELGFHETKSSLRDPRLSKLRQDPRYVDLVPLKSK